MYRIGLASQIYLADGGFALKPSADSRIRSGSRRVNRTKTLDGGVVITDSGYADGDRTLDLYVISSATVWTQLWTIFKLATLVTVTTDDGAFSGAMEAINDNGDYIAIRILIKERISA
jgi:hypothetical protein